MEDESIEWRPVRGLEDRYEVSNTGLVRRKPYILKTHPSLSGGHHQVNLGLRRRSYVHRLVAEAFLDEPEPQRIWINHKNGNPSDNRVENLEWCTPGENISHGYRMNGRVNYNVIKVGAYDADDNLVAEYPSVRAAAAAHNVTPGAVHSALRRKARCRGLYWKPL